LVIACKAEYAGGEAAIPYGVLAAGSGVGVEVGGGAPGIGVTEAEGDFVGKKGGIVAAFITECVAVLRNDVLCAAIELHIQVAELLFYGCVVFSDVVYAAEEQVAEEVFVNVFVYVYPAGLA